MKADIVQLVFALIVLVVGAAAEELLPKFWGVGFPVLLTATLFAAVRRRRPMPGLFFSFAAGAMEDSLAGLPPPTSLVFFFLFALLARTRRYNWPSLGVAYVLYQIWLWIWVPNGVSGLWGRLFAATLLSLASALVVIPVLKILERSAALDER